MSTVRTRTLKQLKYLSAVSAASIGAACSNGGGYGVVDPLPRPSCTDKLKPIVVARYLAADAGVDAGDGSRLVEIMLSFNQPTESTFATPSSTDVDIVESMLATGVGGRILVRVPALLSTSFPTVNVLVSCSNAEMGRLAIRLTLGPTNVDVTTNL